MRAPFRSRAKEFAEAIERYTASIGYRPGQAALHANRGVAYLRLGLFAEAEQDSSTALALQPDHSRARVRRAAARMELGRPQEALQVCRRVCVCMCVYTCMCVPVQGSSLNRKALTHAHPCTRIHDVCKGAYTYTDYSHAYTDYTHREGQICSQTG